MQIINDFFCTNIIHESTKSAKILLIQLSFFRKHFHMLQKNNFMLPIAIMFSSGLAFWLWQIYQPKLPILPETIIVGTTANYPPFSFKQENTAGAIHIVGLDIDIVTEAVRRLNKIISIKNIPFELLIPQAQMGTIHVIAVGLLRTPEREQQILFIPPYMPATSLAVLFLKDKNFKNLEELSSQRIIVDASSSANDYMSKLQHVSIYRLPSPEDAINALKNDLADAYIIEENTAHALFEIYGIDNFKILVIPKTSEQNALAISKLYPQLAQQLSKIVDEMIADGTIEQFKQKWHIEQI